MMVSGVMVGTCQDAVLRIEVNSVPRTVADESTIYGAVVGRAYAGAAHSARRAARRALSDLPAARTVTRLIVHNHLLISKGAYTSKAPYNVVRR